VIPGLIHKFHNAKKSGNESVTIWGDGTPLREFMYVDDLARACLFLLHSYDDELPINIGSGDEVTIAQLARKISDTVGYVGQILYDESKPNGTPRKLLDSSRLLSHGWDTKKQVNLDDGLGLTYSWFLEREYKG
jgi:GDP-L-fucose synthase